MARIRSEADPLLRVPYVPDALAPDDDEGFLSPDVAARRMGVSTGELLRLAGRGLLSTRGRGHGLRVRPALLSGVVEVVPAEPRERRRASASRDRELSGDE